MTASRFVPIATTKDELLMILDDIRNKVEEGDSFEGFLNYLMPDYTGIPEEDEKLKDIDFMVEARYRIGNSMGQGGMRMWGEMKEIEFDPETEQRKLLDELES